MFPVTRRRYGSEGVVEPITSHSGRSRNYAKDMQSNAIESGTTPKDISLSFFTSLGHYMGFGGGYTSYDLHEGVVCVLALIHLIGL